MSISNKTLVIIAFLIMSVDRAFKCYALYDHAVYQLLAVQDITALKFIYSENHGIAFGYLKHAPKSWNFVFHCISGILCLLVVCDLLRKHHSQWARLGVMFFFCGGKSNTLDRIYYEFVIDYVYTSAYDFGLYWNLADIYLNIGCLCLAMAAVREFKMEDHKDAQNVPRYKDLVVTKSSKDVKIA